jgi:hypothetical protein
LMPPCPLALWSSSREHRNHSFQPRLALACAPGARPARISSSAMRKAFRMVPRIITGTPWSTGTRTRNSASRSTPSSPARACWIALSPRAARATACCPVCVNGASPAL